MSRQKKGQKAASSTAYAGGGFVGFAAAAGGSSSASTTNELELFDVNLNADVQVGIRRLGKKDATTKLKALGALKALFEELSNEELELAMAPWSAAYTKVSSDVDRRVRETLNVCHGTLVTRMGKAYAPHLRLVLPAWLCNVHDPVASVRRAAEEAMGALQVKSRAALLEFARGELFFRFEENLRLTESAVGLDRALNETEVAEKLGRVQSCTLAALEFVLREVSSVEVVAEELGALYEASFFFKLARSKLTVVRRAMYSFMRTACALSGQVVVERGLDAVLTATIRAVEEEVASLQAEAWATVVAVAESAEVGLAFAEHDTAPLWLAHELVRTLEEGHVAEGTYEAVVTLLSRLPVKAPGIVLDGQDGQGGQKESVGQDSGKSSKKGKKKKKSGNLKTQREPLNVVRRVPDALWAAGETEALCDVLLLILVRWGEEVGSVAWERHVVEEWVERLCVAVVQPHGIAADEVVGLLDTLYGHAARGVRLVDAMEAAGAVLEAHVACTDTREARQFVQALVRAEHTRATGVQIGRSMATRLAQEEKLEELADVVCGSEAALMEVDEAREVGLQGVLKGTRAGAALYFWGSEAQDVAGLLDGPLLQVPREFVGEFVGAAPAMEHMSAKDLPHVQALVEDALGAEEMSVVEAVLRVRAPAGAHVVEESLLQRVVEAVESSLDTVSGTSEGFVVSEETARVFSVAEALLAAHHVDVETVWHVARKVFALQMETQMISSADGGGRKRKGRAGGQRMDKAEILEHATLSMDSLLDSLRSIKDFEAQAASIWYVTQSPVGKVAREVWRRVGSDFVNRSDGRFVDEQVAVVCESIEDTSRLYNETLVHEVVMGIGESAMRVAAKMVEARRGVERDGRVVLRMLFSVKMVLEEVGMGNEEAEEAAVVTVLQQWTGDLYKVVQMSRSGSDAGAGTFLRRALRSPLGQTYLLEPLVEFWRGEMVPLLRTMSASVQERLVETCVNWAVEEGEVGAGALKLVLEDAVFGGEESSMERLMAAKGVFGQVTGHPAVWSFESETGRQLVAFIMPTLAKYVSASQEMLKFRLHCLEAFEAGNSNMGRALSMLSHCFASSNEGEEDGDLRDEDVLDVGKQVCALVGRQALEEASVADGLCVFWERVLLPTQKAHVGAHEWSVLGAVVERWGVEERVDVLRCVQRALGGLEQEVVERVCAACMTRLLEGEGSREVRRESGRVVVSALTEGVVDRVCGAEDVDRVYGLLEEEGEWVQKCGFVTVMRNMDGFVGRVPAVVEDTRVFETIVMEDEEIEDAVDYYERLHSERFGMMCGWCVVLEMLEACWEEVDVRNELVEYVSKEGVLGNALSCIVPFLGVQGASTGSEWLEKRDWVQEMVRSESLARTAGRLFCWTVQRLPAQLREWLRYADKGVVAQVRRVVEESGLSEGLIEAEMEQVRAYARDHEAEAEEFRVWVEGGGAVAAEYCVDEMMLQVRVELPKAYPLEVAKVCAVKGGNKGMSEAMVSQWVLAMHTLVAFRDGSALDAILLWKSGVDKRFAGVEPCPICYAVMDASNKMPKLQCRVCKNMRFHAGCLVKWFSSAGKSECPLCRSPWVS